MVLFTKIDTLAFKLLGQFGASVPASGTDLRECRRVGLWWILVPGFFSAIYCSDPIISLTPKQPKTSTWLVQGFKCKRTNRCCWVEQNLSGFRYKLLWHRHLWHVSYIYVYTYTIVTCVIYIRVYIYNIYVYIYTNVHIYIYIYNTNVHIYIYIYTYVYIYIHDIYV